MSVNTNDAPSKVVEMPKSKTETTVEAEAVKEAPAKNYDACGDAGYENGTKSVETEQIRCAMGAVAKTLCANLNDQGIEIEGTIKINGRSVDFITACEAEAVETKVEPTTSQPVRWFAHSTVKTAAGVSAIGVCWVGILYGAAKLTEVALDAIKNR